MNAASVGPQLRPSVSELETLEVERKFFDGEMSETSEHPHCSTFAESNFSRYFLRTAEHNLVGNTAGIFSCHFKEYVPRLNLDGSLPCLQDLGSSISAQPSSWKKVLKR